MIKVDYVFEAETPLFTGDDRSAGTLRTLRRQKISVRESVVNYAYTSSQRRDIVIAVLYNVHKAIDWEKIKGERLMRIWGEIHNKVRASLVVQTKVQFLQRLCESWGIEKPLLSLPPAFEIIGDDEFLETVRNESHYLVSRLRTLVKEKKDDVESLFSLIGEPEHLEYKKSFEYVPCISGNSIRGALRRLAMYDFTRRVGITSIDKTLYHILFTGGVLNESTKFEDIERRETFIQNCPMVSVFGSAIGNMTIEGMMSVGMAYPLCSELGTGDKSFWEYLDIIFQTRFDSSKGEKVIELSGELDSTVQMKYEYEVFAKGTKFSHGFRMLDNIDDLSVSAFWHVLTLFRENPIVCGMWAVGNGEINLSGLVIPDGANKPYLDYLEKNREKIQAYFRSK